VRRLLRWSLLVFAVAIAGIYLLNASWLAPKPASPRVLLVAHRGVHQTFDLAGVTNDTCTATRIRQPIAPEIENTLASMRAAFEAGAAVVELDVHPTTDGQFAVFHDWQLECRTNGKGPTRSHSMAYLKTLDVGYGYTADGGKTFPLRSHGRGLMPSLGEVLNAFPKGRFLVNFKSNDAREGERLARLLRENPSWRPAIWGVYGGSAPTQRAVVLVPGMRGYSLGSIKSCLLPYALLGWSGYLPDSCRNTIIPIPVNFAPWLWGWPNRFQARMTAAGSTILLFGPYHRGDVGSSGIDTQEDVGRIPDAFAGFASTNDIQAVAPLIARR